MHVRVRLFASLREVVGTSQLSLDLPGSPTAEDVWATLAAQHPALFPRRQSLTVAVNREYATFSKALSNGDEVVFLPPVSGG